MRWIWTGPMIIELFGLEFRTTFNYITKI
jgi:hypothetical protein